MSKVYTRPSGDSGLSRRAFIQASTAGTLLLATPYVKPSWAADRKITVRDPGGPFTKGFAKAFYEPFAAETGIKVMGIQSDAEPTGMIKAMVDAKNYTWDGALLSRASHQSLVDLGYLAPISGKSGPGMNLSRLPDGFRDEFIMGTDVYATLLAYRTDTMGGTPPTGWKDFWDTKAFPGARALRKSPFDTMEEALLADGVAPSDLYPLNFDRAFRKLDQIKKQIDTWWTNGAQTSQLLASGEVDVLPAWNGRAQVAIDGGAPVKLVWDGALYTFEGWTILKGGPNEHLMREFIEFCAQGKQQALYTPFVAYGPTSPDAYQYIDPKRAKVLPTNPEYLSKMTAVDTTFWGKNKDMASERFEAWLLS